jgi:hypothetical protein
MASVLLTIAPLSHVLEEYELPNQQRDQCIVPQRLFQQWVERHETEVMLVDIVQGDVTVTLCVEGPHSLNQETMYVPQRLLDRLEEGEYAEVRLRSELPPLATQITLQPIDSEVYHCDISAAVSEMLTQWHVLEINTVLSVPLPELGGFMADILVKAIEPEPVALLRGEVRLELAEPFIHVPEFQVPKAPAPVAAPAAARPPTPAPAQPSMVVTDPIAQLFAPQQQQRFPTQNAPGFVPFSGRGYVLGRGNPSS